MVYSRMNDSMEHKVQVIRAMYRHRAQVEEALRAAFSAHELRDLTVMIIRDQVKGVYNDEAFALLEVEQYSKFTALNVFIAAGEMRAVKALYSQAEDCAREAGCTVMKLTGRPGWERALKADGWGSPSTTLFKRLA